MTDAIAEYLATKYSAAETSNPGTDYILAIVIKPAGAGGITRSPKGEFIGNSSLRFPSGTSVTLTVAWIKDGYKFVKWGGDASGTTNVTTLTMDSDKTVEVIFEEIPAEVITYYLQVRTMINGAEGGGTVSPAFGTYPEGTKVTLVATPTTGNKFVKWTGDATGTSSTLTIIMDSNKNITATFMAIPAPTPTPTPEPTDTWQAADVITGLVVAQLTAKDMWQARETVTNLAINAAIMWQAKEVVDGLAVEGATIWVPQEVVTELAISAVDIADTWIPQEVLTGIVVDVAIGEPPKEEEEEEEEEERVTWWPWILGGVGVAVLVGYLARRGQ